MLGIVIVQGATPLAATLPSYPVALLSNA